MDQREGRLRINLAASMAGSVDMQKQCSKTVRTLTSELHNGENKGGWRKRQARVLAKARMRLNVAG
jgi:hypothetical protein